MAELLLSYQRFCCQPACKIALWFAFVGMFIPIPAHQDMAGSALFRPSVVAIITPTNTYHGNMNTVAFVVVVSLPSYICTTR